jgi:subtilase family serine protease
MRNDSPDRGFYRRRVSIADRFYRMAMVLRRFCSARTFVAITFALAVLLTAPVLSPSAFAQTAQTTLVPNRITAQIDESSRTTLKGSVHPLANARNDRGAAPDGMQLERMHLALQRSPAQESALRQFISDLHTPGTASYHKWLTPDQFGAQFGPSDQDIATVESWLASQGFQVTKVEPGKQVIEFSGNVAQMRDGFQAQIHKYVVNGETHYASANDPQIPSALAPVIAGFVALNNFRPHSYNRVLGKATWDPKTRMATPQWTTSADNYAVAPGDFGVQYDLPNASLNPAYTGTTYDGTGQTIAIINDANINIDLVNQFRSTFGLSVNPPQIIIDGNDPGVDGINNPDGPNGDSIEAYLDVEESGAVAPNATIDLVIGADTALESGLFLAAERAVFSNIAPVMSLSFGACEQDLGSTNTFLNDLWEEAAAQGATVMVSTGDTGSASCDDGSGLGYATDGLTVSGYASTPFNVAVGGTDFYYTDYATGGASTSTYWNTTPSPTTPSTSIIKAPIPEQPWNDSQFGLDIISFYTDISGSTATTVGGGAGGASSCSQVNATTGACTGGYAKPAWQMGTGVPADKVRDLPDISLFAANGQNDSYYAICATDGDCQPSSNGSAIQITGIGGTSASSPAFAGIMALVNQKYGMQGQANFVLYPLAAQFPQAFHDVTVGTNAQPCEFAPALSPNCVTAGAANITLAGITEGELSGYSAGTGFDLATGLGSVDASQLISNWGNVKLATTGTTLTPSSTSFVHGTAVTISGAVTVSSGTPTGDVALLTDSTEPVNQSQTFFTLSSGKFSQSVNFLPGGSYNIWGHYGGDSTNAASTSTPPVSITVTPEASTTYFNLLDVATPSTGSVAVNPGSTVPYGTQVILASQLYPTTYYNQCVNTASPPTSCSTATYGIPSGTVVFADSGATVNTAVVNAEGDAEYNGAWSIGSHSVTAKYSGDASYNASSGAAIAFTVSKATPQIIFNSAAATSSGAILTGQSTAITIQIENNSNAANESSFGIGYSTPVAAPTGTVTISGFPSGVPTSGTLSPAVDPSSLFADGVATIIAPSTTPAGTYTVKITYSGDANYNSTTASGSVTIVANSGLASTTTATAVGSTISPTTSITINGTVTGQSGKAAPTGGIVVYSSGNIVTEIGFNSSSGDTSSFSTVLNSQALFQGTNFVTLQYSGDSTYAASSTTLANPIANPLSDFSIVPQTTIVPVTAGSSGTDTINLTSINGFTGTPTFTCVTSTVACTVTSSASLTSGSTTPLTLTINAGSSVANGTYNVLVTGTSGSFIHTLGIEAAVTGGATTTVPGIGLTANPSGLTLTAGATTGNISTITVAPSNGFTGNVALTSSVSGPSGAASLPTVTFSASPLNITGTASLTSVATIATTTTTTAGNYTITVTGTAGSVTGSATISLTVNAASSGTGSFTLSASPATLSLAPGATTGNTSTIAVTPSGGFTGSVALVCTVSGPNGATDPATCALSPTAADVTGTTAVNSTLTITTTAATSARNDAPLKKYFTTAGGIALAMVLFFGIPARRRSWRSILGLLIVLVSIAGIGCGGGGSSGGGGGTGNGGTTAGTYTVTVTGTSGSLTPTTTVTVTVN